MRFCFFIRLVVACVLAAALLNLGGCAVLGALGVTERSPGSASAKSALRRGFYVIKRGDTLYSIGRRTGLSVSTLARLNGLRSPYRIHPGMKLRLRGPAVAAKAPQPVSRRSPAKPRQSSSQASGITWRWPTSSPVVGEFGGVNKGLDFFLAPGSKITSAGDGEVVYAGAGLAGFEQLVIVRHNAQYLSAYSLNQPLSVKEGQRIKAGQAIAAINRDGRAARSVHFQIRRNGEPISPRSVLR